MNKFFSLIILLLIAIHSNAQTPSKEKEQSNAEIFSAKSGALMQKEFIDCFKSFDFQVSNIKINK